MITIPGLDTDKGLSFFNGEEDVYLALLRSFVVNMPVNFSKLQNLSKETIQEYAISIHGLKGISASIGAEALSETALTLEKMAKVGDFDGVFRLNETFLADMKIIVANIKTWLEQYDATNEKPRLPAPSRELLVSLRKSCESYDMKTIDKIVHELDSSSYDNDADLVAWIIGKINISELREVACRIEEYENDK